MQLMEQVGSFLRQLAQERPSYLPPQAKLIIAVSGGPDSLALLHLLQSLYLSDSLVVAHLNHKLRPSAADDAQFVADVAAAWQVPCHIKEVNVAQLAAAEKVSIETAGRLARYQYFAELARELGAGSVAVAHHADDQSETVLMHILRGSGLRGLRGMLPVSTLAGTRSCLLIRPFLHMPRAMIEAYCQQHSLEPRYDITNIDTTFLRNRVRHDLLPVLAQYNPQIKTRLQQLATVVAADYDLLDSMLQASWQSLVYEQSPDYIQLKRAVWLSLPLSLRRRTLRYAVQQLRPSLHDIGFLSIEQARQIVEKGHTGAQTSLPGALTLVVGYETLTLTSAAHPIPTDLPQLPDETPLSLSVPGQVQLAHGWTLTASLTDMKELAQIQNNDNMWTAYVSVAESECLVVRARQAGERLRPLGMKGQTVKIKEMMINRKLPAHLRARWPLVAWGEQVIWVVGHQLDERVRVTADTTSIIRLECQPL